jgi:hypothetical protein
MGTIQKLTRLSESGKLTIEAIPENNKFWYRIDYQDDELETYSYMPTLKTAIDAVYREMEIYNTKINMGKLGEYIK